MPKLLKHGHAPGHVRETFLSAVDAFVDWEEGQPEPTVEYEVRYVPRQITISQACKLVWNCTDTIPGDAFRELRDDGGLEMKTSSYAACARAMLDANKQ